jgi:uncharacterized Fe-S cluster-containing radical SAM superfamily protein
MEASSIQPEHVREAFELVATELFVIEHNDSHEAFAHYFENTWVGK